MKILAAIVTHNRCQLLERCIEHVQGQTRPPDTLLVIDNASTDGTKAMLEAKKIEHITQDNVGSAGGWHRAIVYAIQNGFDWVWLMDDDGYPAREALATLSRSVTSSTACISSVVVCEDEPDRFVFPVPIVDANAMTRIVRWPRKVTHRSQLLKRVQHRSYPFAHLFNGALISTAAAAKIGNVNTEYFLYGDEVDYFYRLREAGEVGSCLDSLHYHPDVSQRSISEMKLYYFVKNSIIIHNRYFNAPAIRNGGVIAISLARILMRNGFNEMASYIFGRRKTVMVRAVVRGMRGQIGKDYEL